MVKILIDLDDKDYQIIENQTRFLGGHGGRVIKAIHEGIVFPSYATNGEVLKAIFPSIGLYEKNHDAIQIDFNSVWWNAPYKEHKDGTNK